MSAWEVGDAARGDSRRVKIPGAPALNRLVGGAIDNQTTWVRAAALNRHGLAAIGHVVAGVHDRPIFGDLKVRAGAVGHEARRDNHNVGGKARGIDEFVRAARVDDWLIKCPGGAALHRFIGGAIDDQTRNVGAATKDRHGLAAIGDVVAGVHNGPRFRDVDVRADSVGHKARGYNHDVGAYPGCVDKFVRATSANNRLVKRPDGAALDGFAGRAINNQTRNVGAAAHNGHGLAAIGDVVAGVHDRPVIGDLKVRAGAVGHEASRDDDNVWWEHPLR